MIVIQSNYICNFHQGCSFLHRPYPLDVRPSLPQVHQLLHRMMQDPPQDSDSASGCSADMSNTDSGRGPSEDGDNHHHHHHQAPPATPNDGQPPPPPYGECPHTPCCRPPAALCLLPSPPPTPIVIAYLHGNASPARHAVHNARIEKRPNSCLKRFHSHRPCPLGPCRSAV